MNNYLIKLDQPKRKNSYLNFDQWAVDFKKRLYNQNKIKLLKINNVYQKQKKKIYKIQQNIQFQLQNTKQFTNTKQCQLPQYPHGFYSNYVFINKSCQFYNQVEKSLFYLEQLKQKQQQKQYQLILCEIGDYLNRGLQKMKYIEQDQRNNIYLRMWQKISLQYVCEIDCLDRMKIYLQTLKYDTEKMFKQNFKCQRKVYEYAIIKSSVYFSDKLLCLNMGLKSFSINKDNQINQTSVAQTMKILFCSICDIYDCGVHVQSSNQSHYITPKNMIPIRDIVYSGISLKQHLFNIKADRLVQVDRQTYCSANCYKKITSSQKYQEVYNKSVNRKILYSQLTRSFLNLAINMFKFDPCELWPILSPNSHIKLTCQSMFVFLTQQYGLYQRITRKMFNSQYAELLSISSAPKNKVKEPKKKKEQQRQQQLNKISICKHYYLAEDPFDLTCSSCDCQRRGYCLPQCQCSQKCTLKVGCKCKGQCNSDRCECKANSRECEQGLCMNCFDGCNSKKQNKCRNNVKDRRGCLLRVGRSKINNAGLGLFAGQNIKAKQFVCYYTGQIINRQTQIVRQSLRQTKDFYNFALSGDSVDSRFIGNKSRFMNHGSNREENVVSQTKRSKGKNVILFYAKRDIKKNEQLYFDYDGDGELYRLYSDIYPFVKPKK